MSAIIFVDSVYNHYFNSLPSISLLKQMSQVTAVGDSVKDLLNPLNIFLIADIPFFAYILVEKRERLKVKEKFILKSFV